MNGIFAAVFAFLAGPALAQNTQLEVTDDSNPCVYRDVCADDAEPGPRRADDRTPYDRFREFFFPEAGVDPMRRKYEELFDRPYPPAGNRQFEPDSPFAEVHKFDDAFDRDAIAGAKTEFRSDADSSTVSVLVPDSEKKDLHVFVNDERILLSLAAPRPPSPYYIVRRQELSIPDPPGIDPTTAAVDRQGDEIRISFVNENAKD